MPVLNDGHSSLNPTEVARVERPATIASLRAVVRAAAREGHPLSCDGGRHALRGSSSPAAGGTSTSPVSAP